MYYTYVLQSLEFNKIYIGFSSDVEKRLQSHNDVRNSGWTRSYQPWKIIHLEEYKTKQDAMKKGEGTKNFQGIQHVTHRKSRCYRNGTSFFMAGVHFWFFSSKIRKPFFILFQV